MRPPGAIVQCRYRHGGLQVGVGDVMRTPSGRSYSVLEVRGCRAPDAVRLVMLVLPPEVDVQIDIRLGGRVLPLVWDRRGR